MQLFVKLMIGMKDVPSEKEKSHVTLCGHGERILSWINVTLMEELNWRVDMLTMKVELNCLELMQMMMENGVVSSNLGEEIEIEGEEMGLKGEGRYDNGWMVGWL